MPWLIQHFPKLWGTYSIFRSMTLGCWQWWSLIFQNFHSICSSSILFYQLLQAFSYSFLWFFNLVCISQRSLYLPVTSKWLATLWIAKFSDNFLYRCKPMTTVVFFRIYHICCTWNSIKASSQVYLLFSCNHEECY